MTDSVKSKVAWERLTSTVLQLGQFNFHKMKIEGGYLVRINLLFCLRYFPKMLTNLIKNNVLKFPVSLNLQNWKICERIIENEYLCKI